MMYLYKIDKTGPQEWSVIEMTVGTDDERVVARCVEWEDARTILNCFAAIDAGDIVLPERIRAV